MTPESPETEAPEAEAEVVPLTTEAAAASGVEASSPGTDGSEPSEPEYPADAPIPVDPNFRIQLPGFEGPLDLLLYLIKKHELDILDLPIAFITEKYLEYIGLMEELNLDVASEYLVMAATLAHIKSKTLLPRPPDDQDEEDEDELDPRAELIRRLLEYQKYKRAGESLGSRGIAGRDVFPRGIPTAKAEGPAPLAEFSVFKLIDAFQAIVKRKKGTVALEVDAERITIQERISQIVESLRRAERTPFERLFDGSVTTYDLVVTFLALLEMAKMRLLKIYQSAPTEPIYLEARILDEDAVRETIAHAGADFGETPVAGGDVVSELAETVGGAEVDMSEAKPDEDVTDTEQDGDPIPGEDTDPGAEAPDTIPPPAGDASDRSTVPDQSMPGATIPAPPPDMPAEIVGIPKAGKPPADLTGDENGDETVDDAPDSAESLENGDDSEQDRPS